MNNAPLIGQTAQYRVVTNPKSGKWLDVDVIILAERVMFGRPEIRIKPAQGTGEVWICSESVKVKPI